MDKALFARDDTPNHKELHDAFDELNLHIDSMSVLFDIGTAAKNNESILHIVYRHILQMRPRTGIARKMKSPSRPGALSKELIGGL